MSRHDDGRARSIRQSIHEYTRGLAGGMIFSLHILYTMEVWWTGHLAVPLRLLAFIGFIVVMLFGFNRFAGLRRDKNWGDVAIDTIEELGIGIVVAAIVLWLLGQIDVGMSSYEIVGKVTVGSLSVAVGVSIGTVEFGDGEKNPDKGIEGYEAADSPLLSDVIAAVCGAFLFSATVAPTQEITLIASETDALRLIGMALVSLVVGVAVLHHTEERDVAHHAPGGRIGRLVLGATLTYAAALVVAAILLWLYGRFDDESLYTIVAATVVLGLVGAFGAAAGRMFLK